MKEIFKTNGITLIELLIVISLTGLIFALGITPILSQLRLTRAERSEISLFDEANLATFYINKDAAMASGSSLASGASITLIINRGASNVVYTASSSQLIRSQVGVGSSVITNKLDPDIGSGFGWLTYNGQHHHLTCALYFKDPDNSNITTRRVFDVMLRCKSAGRVP